MVGNIHIHRAYDLVSEIAEQNAVIRKIVAGSLEVLRAPMPDTFLGRKTQEPFPRERKE